jgi:hypothetical protein
MNRPLRSLVPGLGACLLLSLTLLPAAAAQQNRAAPPPCSDPAHRQFDFWLGEWEVFQADTLAGHSRISRPIGDCMIFEEWTGRSGYQGKSFNFFEPGAERWRQIWVDSSGGVLDLTGGLRDGSMVLVGTSPGASGPVRNRITWTPNREKGTVRQLWETSEDEGKSWTIAFDGEYRR